MARLRTHPGEVLKEEYLVPLGLSARALAKELDVPANRLTEIMRGTRDVSAEIAREVLSRAVELDRELPAAVRDFLERAGA